MAASHIGGGTLAAAVLGVGSVASASAPAATTAGDAGVGESTRVLAVEVGRQLAATGSSTTMTFVYLGVVLLIAGLLLVGLARRHALTKP